MPKVSAITNKTIIPPSIGSPGGGGGIGGGGVAPWAIDAKPAKKSAIEANIFFFSIL
ncbi:hypothetical protein [Winogradskyella sp. R77965]|uniref:hypothetical protein n=1 Tax=Winogradskyella sp. R77965 TaxID=3093872 RepID=UPI0037DD945B